MQAQARQNQYREDYDPEIQYPQKDESSDELQKFFKEKRPNRGDPQDPCWFCCCCGCLPVIGILKSLISVIPVTIIYFIGCTVINLLFLPQTLLQCLYTLVVTEKLGINLKVAGFLVVPLTLLFYIPFQILCCLFLGFGVGMFVPIYATFRKEYNLFCGGPGEAVGFAIYHIKKYWKKHNVDLFKKLKEYREEKVPENQVIDVYFFYILFAMVVSVIGIVINMVAFTFMGFVKYIPGLYSMYKSYNEKFWKQKGCCMCFIFIFYVIGNILMPFIALLGYLIFILSSFGTGIYTSKYTYNVGIIRGLKQCFINIKEADQYTNEICGIKSTGKLLKNIAMFVLLPILFILKIVIVFIPITVLYTIPGFLIYLFYLPRHFCMSYYSLFKLKLLGPNLKFLSCFVVPLPLLLAPFLLLIGSLIIGIGQIFSEFCKASKNKKENIFIGGVKNIFEEAIKHIKGQFQINDKSIPNELEKFRKMEKTEENYYEISIVYIILAALVGLFNSFVFLLGFMVSGFFKIIPASIYLIINLFTSYRKDFDIAKALLLPAFVIVQPLIPCLVSIAYIGFILSGIYFGLRTCKTTYYKGVKKGIQLPYQEIKDVHKDHCKKIGIKEDFNVMLLGCLSVIFIPLIIIIKLVGLLLIIAPYFILGSLLILTITTPRNVILTQMMICRLKTYGINLKVVGVLLAPIPFLFYYIGSLLFYIIEILAYCIVNPFRFQSMKKESIIKSAIVETFDLTQKHLHDLYEQNNQEFLKNMDTYEKNEAKKAEQNKEGKPFDIYFFHIIYGVIIGAIGAVIVCLCFTILGLFKFMPGMYAFFIKHFLFDNMKKDIINDNMHCCLIFVYLLQLFCLLVIVPIGSLIVYIGAILYGLIVGFGRPLIQTYNVSICAGFNEIPKIIIESHMESNKKLEIKSFKQILYVYSCCGCLPLLAIIKSLIFCIPMALINFIAFSCISIIHIFQHLSMAYFTLWQYQLIGWNLKTLLAFFIWIPVVFQIPVFILLGTLYGFFSGLSTPLRRAFDKNEAGQCCTDIQATFSDTKENIQKFQEYNSVTFLKQLQELREKKLRNKDDQPFDIYFAYIILALFIGIVGIVINTLLFSLLGFFKIAPGCVKCLQEMYKEYFKNMNCCYILLFPLFLLCHFLVIGFVVLVYIFQVLFGILSGLRNVKKTYQIGFVDAVEDGISHIDKWNTTTNELCNITNPQLIGIIYAQLVFFGGIGALIYFVVI